MGLANNILGLALLLPKQLNQVLNPDWYLCFYWRWEFRLVTDRRSVTYSL